MNFDIKSVKELNRDDNIGINMDNFEKICDVVKKDFDKLGISSNGMLIYYQRYSYAASVLAIKVLVGDDNDVSNYIVSGCRADYNNNMANCDVYLHSVAKNNLKLVDLVNLISNDIVTFFEKMENDLLKKQLINLDCSFVIPLTREKSNGIKNKETNLKKKIHSLFKR